MRHRFGVLQAELHLGSFDNAGVGGHVCRARQLAEQWVLVPYRLKDQDEQAVVDAFGFRELVKIGTLGEERMRAGQKIDAVALETDK